MLEIHGVTLYEGRIAVAIFSNEDNFKKRMPSDSFWIESVNTIVTQNVVLPEGEYVITVYRLMMQEIGARADALLKAQWLALIPAGWLAEQIALDNLRRGIYPPDPAAGMPDLEPGADLFSFPASGSWKNPYREWIGAQMRGAVCGQVAPGNPREAARLAWLDGVVSHTGNGALGEVFNALLVSLAFIESDMRRCLDRAIAFIPADSEYYVYIFFKERKRHEKIVNGFAALPAPDAVECV
jgi:hypothetical protein